MKNSLKNSLSLVWSVLTDVPGWPDAPRSLRFRRLVPIALPLAATALILLWNVAWRNPRVRAERAAQKPLTALETAVTNLRLAYSDQQASEIAKQADDASRILLPDPSQLPPLVERLHIAAASFGWDASLIPTAAPSPPSPTEAQIYFLPVRGRLRPASTNTEPFNSLLAFLDKLPAADKWIDLMRLSLRADEQGKLTVELLLRAGCRVPDEKTAQ